jgi:long-subunit fatty acid transport protein
MATGGVMGSLGGDITAANVNPAGLGLFKTNEFVFTPGIGMNNNRFSFRGKDSAAEKNSFNYGPIGFIFGTPHNPETSKWTSSAFSISVNQLASYNNRVSFKGYNNFSSFTEQYLEELVRDRADSNAALSNYIFGSSLAFRTYLVDTSNDANGIFNGYKSMVDLTAGVNQEYDAVTRGGYHEIAMGLAGNLADKVYIGGSFVVPVVSYHRELTYSETDASNNPNNNFKSFTYTERTRSTGVGWGVKLGIIYKPQEFWRLGFAFHAPQFITFRDYISSSLSANTEAYAGSRNETSDALNSGKEGQRRYNLQTPWRAIISGSYVFREVHDTRKQRAFISADIEYVNYRGARFQSAYQGEELAKTEEEDIVMRNYLNEVTNGVKNYYKGNLNFRLGGELKFNTIMFRLGGAFYGSPYADKELKANKILATGGIGYRDHGIFIDLGYAHSFNKDVVFPYRLNDKPNTFAEQNSDKGNVVLTFGFKF